MLRYRLSLSPKNTGERKGLGAEPPDSEDPFLTLGGPLQEAIRGDLVRLFRPFVAVIRDASYGRGSSESAFDAFKEFFKKHKIALLHHLAPSKSDVSAYSQLLYAVCFSIIRDTFKDQKISTQSSTFFERVAYGTFLLYTLYQTNPLPSPPKEDSLKGQLEMLPFGLFDRRCPKESSYAKHYRAPIRIDLEHYGYLIRLLDLTRATSMVDHPGIPSSLLQDLRAIVHRIMTSNTLEFCAYTGPCGLGGLAGRALHHNDDDDGGETSASVAMSQPQPWTDDSILPSSVDQLKQYMDRLKAIRLPALSAKMSNQSRRIRSSLEPVFSNTSPLDNMMELESEEAIKALKQRRHVSFGAVTTKALEDVPSTDVDGVPEVVLPEGTPTELAESIQSAIRTLSDRGEDLLLPNKESGSSLGICSRSVLSAGTSFEDASGVGRNALTTLLKHANDAHYRTTFLAAQPVRNTKGGLGDPGRIIENLSETFGSISDLSSDDEDQDEVSVAVSRAGQSALQELLKAASEVKPCNHKRSTAKKIFEKKRQTAPLTGDTPLKRRRIVTDAQHSNEIGTAEELLLNSISESTNFSGENNPTSDSSHRSNIGANALRNLLDQARDTRRHGDNQADVSSYDM